VISNDDLVRNNLIKVVSNYGG